MRRSAFVLFLLGACVATAAAGALLASSQVVRGAAIAAPPLAGAFLLLASRRSNGTRPRKLAERISELTEELQRDRIDSANRLAALEARLTALEDEHVQVAEARDRHRDELRQIGRALTAHQAAIDVAVAGHGD